MKYRIRRMIYDAIELASIIAMCLIVVIFAFNIVDAITAGVK